MATKNILFRVGMDASQFTKQSAKVQDSFKKLQTNVNTHSSSIGGSFMKMGTLIKTALSVYAVKSIADFTASGIKMASDLKEVQNVVDTAFGSSSDTVDKWAKNAINNYGESELQAKKFAGTMRAMTGSMGLSNQAADEMSMTLAGLAGDFASFYNIDVEDAFSKIRSGISGETEPLRQLGINMLETNLQAYALSKGITKSYQAMTQAEKTTLRYNYLLDNSKMAQGDFTKTSGTFANQMRLMKNNFDRVAMAIGNAFIPILEKAMPYINNFLNSIANGLGVLQKFSESIFGTNKMQSKGTGIATKYANAQSDVADSIKEAGEAAKKSLASFDELNTLDSDSAPGIDTSSVTSPIMSIDTEPLKQDTQTIKNLFSKIGEYYKKNFQTPIENAFKDLEPQFKRFGTTTAKMITDIQSLSEPLKELFVNNVTPLLQNLVAEWGNILTGLFDTFNTVFSDIWNIAIFPVAQKWSTTLLPMWADYINQMVSTIGVGFTEIKKTFDMLWSEGAMPAITNIMNIWSSLVDTVKSLWDQYGATTFDNIRNTIKTMGDNFSVFWNNVFKPIWDNLMQAVDWLWTKHLQPLAYNIGEFIMKLVNGAMDIYNKFISPIAQWLTSIFGPVFTNIFNTIINIVGSVIGVIADVASGIFKSLGGIIDFIVGIFTGDWKKAWEGIKSIFSGIFDAVSGIFKGVINIIIDLINGFTGGLNWIPQTLSKVPGFGWAKDWQIPKIPKMNVGTRYLPYDMLIQAHQGEMIVPKSENPYANSGGGIMPSSAPTKIIIQIGSKVLGEAVVESLNDLSKANGILNLI